MTPLEYNQIKENFKPPRLVDEVLKIHNDISEITWILFTTPFNMEAARQKIDSINREHFDNYLFYFLMNPTNDNFTPVSNASSESLRQDLSWKKTYLEIKADAKTLTEVIRQLESLCNHSL